jgi:alanyl aminopeptidase
MVVAACSGPAKPPVVVPPPQPPPAADYRPAPPAVAMPDQPALRLPKNFVETRANVELTIDPAADGFDGYIELHGKVTEASGRFWLHAIKLDIADASIIADATDTPIALVAKPVGADLLELDAAKPVDAGDYHFSIKFHGRYDLTNTTGAFKQVVAGAPYVFSQFEAIYARRAFPCVDEPDAKIPWQLTLRVPKDLVAVANTPVEHDVVDGAIRTVAFATTRPLPSYLVAFGVGPFEIVDAGTTKSGVPVRAITLHGRAADAAWAAQTTPRILDELEAWFGVKYPYPKLDVLSIPLTVGFGAMENAGLVTFTESLILLDPQKASLRRKASWVAVASHELAHQWFGDSVTMDWWDDIWLNEGFADWLERRIAARVMPEWHLELGVLDERRGALAADSVVSARAVRQPIATPDDILNVFDGITYEKGASVLAMFESYVGPDKFQQGIRDYVAAHADGNASVTDFVAAISRVHGSDLAPAFATFLDQAGAPELTGSLDCRGTPKLALAQHRYLPVGSPAAPDTKPWIVPVCVAYDRDGARAEACGLVSADANEVALPAKRCPRWTYANADGHGYYHLAHTADDAAKLRDEAWSQLTPIERRALFAEVSDAARQGQLALPLALSFVPRLLAAGDRFSVGDAIGFPRSLDRYVTDDVRAKYESWLRATFAPAATAAGLTPKKTDDLDAESERGDLVGEALAAHEPALVAEAVKQADHWRDLPQSTRGLVLGAAVEADAAVFARVLRDVHDEADRARRNEAYGALANVSDLAKQRQALALVIDDKLDIRETRWILFGSRTLANEAQGRQFFRDHQAAILARMPSDDTTGESVSIANLFMSCDPKLRDEAVAYVTATFGAMPGAKHDLAEDIEQNDQCIARHAVVEPMVRGWLTGVKIPKPPSSKKNK